MSLILASSGSSFERKIIFLVKSDAGLITFAQAMIYQMFCIQAFCTSLSRKTIPQEDTRLHWLKVLLGSKKGQKSLEMYL